MIRWDTISHDPCMRILIIRKLQTVIGFYFQSMFFLVITVLITIIEVFSEIEVVMEDSMKQNVFESQMKFRTLSRIEKFQ